MTLAVGELGRGNPEDRPRIFITQHLYWPVARYGTVAIAPTALVLCLGLAEILPQRISKEAAWLDLLGLLALEAVAM